MKKILPIAVAGALLLVSLASSQDPVDQEVGTVDLEARIGALEKELAQTREELVQTRALLDETVAWIQARATREGSMLTVLDQSEAAGFVPGVNFHSREIFLAGLRNMWGASDKGLPGKKKPATKTAEAGKK